MFTKCTKNITNKYVQIGVVAVMLSIIGIAPGNVFAQTGTATGPVADASTGEDITGAKIFLVGTGYETTTGIDGGFTMQDIPTGEKKIEIAQIQALNRQRESENINKVISHARIDRFADYTIRDALARVPGVQVGPRGEVNLRGAGLGRFLVKMDGRRLASTGAGDRSFDLATISTDMVQDIEVIKTLTPDMDADAGTGTINLVTRRQAVGEVGTRDLNVRIGGGANHRYVNYSGLGSRASLNYAEQLTEELFIDVNLSHQLDQRGRESLQLGYDVHDFGDGPQDVIENISPNLETDRRNRVGGGLQLNFQPTEQHRFHVWGSFNNNAGDWALHRDNWNANESWTESDGEQLQGNLGSYGYDMRYRDSNTRQYAVEVGADHQLDFLRVNYDFGWAQSNFNQNDYLFPFLEERLEFTLNMEDRTQPFMSVEDPFDRSSATLQDFFRVFDNHTDDTFTGRIDLEFLFGTGSFKVGSSYRHISKNGDFTNRSVFYRPRVINDFNRIRGGDFLVLDQENYNIANMLEPERAQVFFENTFPRFRRDDTFFRENSEIWNYDARERVLAGYGMATLELGPVTVMGGARLEHEDNRYDGRKVEFSMAGRYSDTYDTTSTTDKLHVFPNVQIKVSPFETTNLQMAYSQSLTRPVFNQLAPFQFTNLQDTTMFRGNSDLDPIVYDNLDVIVEQYLGEGGLISVGLFYKNLSGFTYIREQTIEIERGEFEVFDDSYFADDEELMSLPVHSRRYQNSDEEATVYGAEISWQHHLTFLPGFLNNFGVYANYTWSQSDFKVDEQLEGRDDEVRFPGQSPHVVNFALDYTQGRFSSQISYHWTDEALAPSGLQPERRPAPALGDEEVFMDRYQEGWQDVSASFRYRITDSFRLWADVHNLLGGFERVKYEQNRDYYPTERIINGGRALNMGFTYNL